MRILRSAVIALAILGALVGCAAPSAEDARPDDPVIVPDTSAEPTASPSSDPRAPATIVISSTWIHVVADDGSAILELDHQSSDPAVIKRLADALGVVVAGQFVPAPNTTCISGSTRYDFGGFTIEAPEINNFGPGAILVIIGDDATNDGVSIMTSQGVRVGSTEAELTAATGGTIPLWAHDGERAVGFDLISDEAGSVAVLQGGIVTGITTPLNLYWDC